VFRETTGKSVADAHYTLGRQYFSGQGVEQDYGQALKWFRRAAERGLVLAQFAVATMCFRGQGIAAPDHAAAAEWYRKAAEQGHVEAQFALGNLYSLGQGVPLDFATAMEWYRKAAAQGHAEARLNLGSFHDRGPAVAPGVQQAAGR
jgi:TPR repeat protein